MRLRQPSLRCRRGGIGAENASSASRFDRLTAKNGEPYFVLKSGNNEIMGKSEMNLSKSSMENGIASVKKNAASKNIKANLRCSEASP